MENTDYYMFGEDGISMYKIADIDKFLETIQKDNAIEEVYLMNRYMLTMSEALVDLTESGVLVKMDVETNELLGIEEDATHNELVGNTLNKIIEVIGKTKAKELDQQVDNMIAEHNNNA